MISNESSVSKGHSSTSSATSSDALLNRKSEAIIVLAENQPIELGADVVRSEGSSWDDVAELESGRTKNLLAHWNKTEQEYAQPKTSTTRSVYATQLHQNDMGLWWGHLAVIRIYFTDSSDS